MMDKTSGILKELQDLDLAAEEIKNRIAEFEPLLVHLEEPALALEQELAAAQKRLQEMQVEERRLESSADDRRARAKTVQERLKAVRNLREEAAVQAEIDLLQQTLEGDEREALSLLDQIRKLDVRIEDLTGGKKSARSEVEPRRQELLEAQAKAELELTGLIEKRVQFTDRIPGKELQDYERIRGGGRSVAVAALTSDGACGHCFGMVPLQVQNEMRAGAALIPCEFCGVLLGAEAPLD
jgi:predicted  nucleic acid-binding Zn-ribbon protein